MEPSKPPSDPPRKATTPRKTASTLLAQFLPGAKTEHKMDSIARRAKTPVNYAESEASSNSSPETPKSQRMSELDQDELDQDEDDDEDTAIEYGRSTGRELRKRQPNRSIKAMENGYVPRKSSNNKKADHSALDELAGHDLPPILNSRSAIRQEIASKTGAYRNQFLIEKKDLWLPLLPNNNYVRKLIEKHDQHSAAEAGPVPPVSPYEEIETQPLGVKATMKPYQLSGLSFLVYLHRNGLSGILGDEMGLGKTLQTLSLIQYIKENEPKAGTGKLQRPCLVVCPLSVLSSWISEAKKWTPGLKVLRFHGPVRERIRLKKIAAGEIDIHGNMTAQAKAKLKARKGSSSRNAINLDTDSEDEEDVGVDLVVTTYECYRMENSWFKSAFVWRWAILDEGHAV
jgi:SWI/SNF-related matrix-associated actin-dependent regulator of chromatin subfamily A member 5